MTSVYSYSKDPQRGTYAPCNFDYMANFYNSVAFYGLKTVIFHDCYDEKFVQEHSTNLIEFIRVVSPIKEMSTNDFRFLEYKTYVENSYNDYDYYLMADASDVFFNGNPFVYMDLKKHADGHTLFMSLDIG